MRPLRLLLLGAPGSGKGTQTSKLLQQFPNLVPISSGDLLRQQIQARSNIGMEASEFIKQGKLVPDMLITELIADKINLKKSNWILDGFPRTMHQAKSLSQILNPLQQELNLVIELDVPQSVILGRIQNRYIHPGSGRTYNPTYNPPKVEGKDDITGEPLVKRIDDNEATLVKRLKAYNSTIGDLRNYYSDMGILTKVTGDTSDVIYPQVLDIIRSRAT